MTVYLTLHDALGLCDLLGVKVRDLGLLDSALFRPQAEFAGVQAYETIPLKAAALLHSITKNHSLNDGNKRLAWMLTDVFLHDNGYAIGLSQAEAVDFMLWVAGGDHDVEDIADRLAIRKNDG